MSQRQESPERALSVLADVRRRLANQLADRITERGDDLLAFATAGDDPFTATADLERLSRGLANVNHAIAAMRAVAQPPAPSGAARGPRANSRHAARPFDVFCDLVDKGCLEEAARELTGLIRLPSECAFTATHFFTRAVAADPAVRECVNALCARIESSTDAECMKVLVAAFGLQAVESTTAVRVLRGRLRGGGPLAAGPPAAPPMQLQAAVPAMG